MTTFTVVHEGVAQEFNAECNLQDVLHFFSVSHGGVKEDGLGAIVSTLRPNKVYELVKGPTQVTQVVSTSKPYADEYELAQRGLKFMENPIVNWGLVGAMVFMIVAFLSAIIVCLAMVGTPVVDGHLPPPHERPPFLTLAGVCTTLVSFCLGLMLFFHDDREMFPLSQPRQTEKSNRKAKHE